MALRPPVQPTPWDAWLQGTSFKNNAARLLVSCRGIFLDPGKVLMPGYSYVLQLHKKIPGGPGSVSGFYNVAGDFQPLPTPTVPTLWKQWLHDNGHECPHNTWVTADGAVLNDFHVLVPRMSHVLRFRARLKGGTKEARAKLRQHLLAKGVPEDAVQGRMEAIMQIVSDEQLSTAYKSLEPWASIKNLVGNRLRLVTPEEVKAKKKPAVGSKPNPTAHPWLASDPWSEGRAELKPKDEAVSSLDVHLLPEFFAYEDGTSPEVLQQVCRDSKRGLPAAYGPSIGPGEHAIKNLFG